MKRDELDSRYRDAIALHLHTLEHFDGGYAGNINYDRARGVMRAVAAAGIEVLTDGPGVTIDVARILEPVMMRFQWPRYGTREIYARDFADRLINALYASGLSLR